MTKQILSKESEFIVGDKKWLLILLSLIFLGVFLVGFSRVLNRGFKDMTILDYLNFGFLFLSVIYLFRLFSKHIYIRINKTGIYQNEKLVTPWSNFLKADVTRQSKLLSIKDDLVLVVEYINEESDKGFRRVIPLANTQDQSIEDIVAAVRFFWNEYYNES